MSATADARSGLSGAAATARGSRFAKIEAALSCPECRGKLDDDLACVACGASGQRRGQQLRFGGFEESELRSDPLNRIKETVKRRFSRVYPLAISALSPVLSVNFVKPFLRSFDLDRELVADLGSGTHRRDPRLVCIDGGAYDEVDIVTDLRRLPLADGSLAGAMSIAVLEHVTDPAEHIAEMHRVLAPGGRVMAFVPFMQPFHASPYDYQRYTKVGLAEQFPGFEVLSVKVGAGPTSALVWVLQEWLAMTLSFGSEKLYRALVPLTWILSPLKLLDLLLVHHPSASVIASGFVIEARKIG
ncbi:methyltransferase domain-containing protein [Allorhizocola rhizosphaerae]|uniref:methyltransferase domain-containing protein n=1 Tax=Allorhizocola rhizosphaerae TaxID=1872709 RepID=UPI0013C2C13B|nr:class I SAM-dependent methyltransferase [Allorhizocola rhizosphaerae]